MARGSQQRMSDNEDDRLTNTLLTLNTLYQLHVQPYLPEALQPISNQVSIILLSSAPYLSQLIGLLRGVLASATNLADGENQNQAILSIGVLLITMYMGLKIMNYVRRTIMGWVWFGTKLFLLLLVVQIGVYVNSFGWEKAMTNAGWFGGIVWGVVEQMINGDGNRQPRGTRRRQTEYNNVYGAGVRGRY